MINYILDIREEFELKESRVIPNKKKCNCFKYTF